MKVINEIEVYAPGDPSVGIPDFGFNIIPGGTYLIDLDELGDTEEGIKAFQKALKSIIKDMGEMITGESCQVHFINYEDEEKAAQAEEKYWEENYDDFYNINPQDTMLP
jgi:hypothetical protein